MTGGEAALMDLRYVTPEKLEEHDVDELPALLERDDGYVWLDVPTWTGKAGQVLKEVLRFHPVAVGICRESNRMPMVHGYADHVFLVLHRPLLVSAGRMHPIEMDIFMSERFLVTVHGPVHPAVTRGDVLSEVNETLDRMEARRIWPASPIELLHALISLTALRLRVVGQEIALRVGNVEDAVLGGEMADPEGALEEMFLVRQELLVLRTMASHGAEVLSRARRLLPGRSPAQDALIGDLEDMLSRVHRMTADEAEFLVGVIELYRTRTDTKMMIAAERLAVLAAVTLPVTAIASVYGMNVIVNETTHVVQLVLVLTLMATICGVLLRWTKNRGWW
jgi:Mg2+ and Co2+ transporter CorA